jgi:segregation and condensation protein B
VDDPGQAGGEGAAYDDVWADGPEGAESAPEGAAAAGEGGPEATTEETDVPPVAAAPQDERAPEAVAAAPEERAPADEVVAADERPFADEAVAADERDAVAVTGEAMIDETPAAAAEVGEPAAAAAGTEDAAAAEGERGGKRGRGKGRKGKRGAAEAEGAPSEAVQAEAPSAAPPDDPGPPGADAEVEEDSNVIDLAASAEALRAGRAATDDEGAEDATGASAAEADADEDLEFEEGEASAEGLSDDRLVSVVESLLFASDKPLGLPDLKRLLAMRDGKRILAAVEALTDRQFGAGVQVISVAGGWRLRTNPENGPWVGKLLVGKPVRLSRAMLETLAIIAYRQPITRPEVDEIRGVDCGPVLKTLLDRSLIRVIGKREEVGRPLLYGTTGDFLRVFNLKDLTELPTLREFHELNAESQAKLDAKHGKAPGEPALSAEATAPGAEPGTLAGLNKIQPHAGVATPDPDEDEELLEELDRATQAAARATGANEPPAPPTDPSSN